MNIEPTNAPINEDDHEPATKGDVRKSQEELAEIVGNAIAHESNKLRTELKAELASKEDVDNLQTELKAELASKSDIDGINRRLDDLVTVMDKRVTKLEQKAAFRQ